MYFTFFYFYIFELVSKQLDLVRGQGTVGFESGAYTIVLEHFESDCNIAIRQEMKLWKPVHYADRIQ